MDEDTSNANKLRVLVGQLSGLLEANEVGLHTWHDAVERKIDEIAALSTYHPAVRDAFDILKKIPVPVAQEWVQKVTRLGLVKPQVHVEVRPADPRSLPQRT